MRRTALFAAAAIAAALLPGKAPTDAAGGDTALTLAAMLWQKRPLLIFAPRGDIRIARQRELIAGSEAAVRQRDLAIVTIVGDAVSGAADGAGALRRRYNVDPAAFAIVLVGKDGGEKLRSAEPLPAARLFATIDAMPMRRGEMRR